MTTTAAKMTNKQLRELVKRRQPHLVVSKMNKTQLTWWFNTKPDHPVVPPQLPKLRRDHIVSRYPKKPTIPPPLKASPAKLAPEYLMSFENQLALAKPRNAIQQTCGDIRATHQELIIATEEFNELAEFVTIWESPEGEEYMMFYRQHVDERRLNLLNALEEAWKKIDEDDYFEKSNDEMDAYLNPLRRVTRAALEEIELAAIPEDMLEFINGWSEPCDPDFYTPKCDGHAVLNWKATDYEVEHNHLQNFYKRLQANKKYPQPDWVTVTVVMTED